MIQLKRSIAAFAKYVRVEYCSRCDFQKEFQRLQNELQWLNEDIKIQGLKTSLRTGKFEVSVCSDKAPWRDIYSGLNDGKPEKATIHKMIETIKTFQ